MDDSIEPELHPFFLFEEPENAKACVAEARRLLESTQRMLQIYPKRMSGDNLTPSLNVLWKESHCGVPSESFYRDNAMRRCVSLMKRYVDDNQVLDDCSVILANLCGECTRPEVIISVCLPNSKLMRSLEVHLPDFAGGDVGCRIWGASSLLSRKLSDGDIEISKYDSIVELGAASGLCGLIACELLRQGSKSTPVFLTDYNEVCLQVAQENIVANDFHHAKVEFLDWDAEELNPRVHFQNALLLGAAVVYEKVHGRHMQKFLRKAFWEGGVTKAVLAIHEEHSGFDEFIQGFSTRTDDLKNPEELSLSMRMIERCLVLEDDGQRESTVCVLEITQRK